jgi:hypothetical protein
MRTGSRFVESKKSNASDVEVGDCELVLVEVEELVAAELVVDGEVVEVADGVDDVSVWLCELELVSVADGVGPELVPRDEEVEGWELDVVDL